MIIRGAEAVMTGLPGKEARAGRADIRIHDGAIAEVGRLVPKAGEEVVDAAGCVVYPAWVNTHHHLFQTVMKGIPDGINHALREWLVSIPSTYRGGLDAEALRISARVGGEMVVNGLLLASARVGAGTIGSSTRG